MGNCCGGTATVPSEPTTKPQPEPSHPAKTTQTNYQTSESSLDGSYQKSSVVSSYGGNEKHAHTTVQDNRGTVSTATSSSRPRALIPSRALSQDGKSSQPHHDGTDNLPSWGVALASQDPRRQETFPHGTSSGRMKRINSENVSGYGRTPQFGPFLTPWAGQMQVEGQERRPRFPSTLQGLLSNDFRYVAGRFPISPRHLCIIVHRFRILVVGKVRVIF